MPRFAAAQVDELLYCVSLWNVVSTSFRNRLMLVSSTSTSTRGEAGGGDRTPAAHDRALLDEKIGEFEAKKRHGGPTIEKMLSIIGQGVTGRLTINNEVLLHPSHKVI